MNRLLLGTMTCSLYDPFFTNISHGDSELSGAALIADCTVLYCPVPSCAIYESYNDGTMQEIAQKYGVQEALVEQPESTFTQADTDSDVEYIKNKGTFIVGITEFAPMDYKDDNGEWIGFDADMAKLVAEKLGVEVKFQVIDWDMKIMELNSKNIDAVWNGMTLTNEVTESMDCTNAYCNNAQVVVVAAE